MFARLLRDSYDPYEHHSALNPRSALAGLLEDYSNQPSYTRFRLNISRPRRQTSTSYDVRNDTNKFEVMLNVKHFMPYEIDIKTVDNFVVIHGKHEEQADEHGFVSREFTRRYQLPDDVEPETITSSLSKDGVLKIQAPRKQLEPPPNERVVPITIQQPAAVEEAQKQQEIAAASAQASEEQK